MGTSVPFVIVINEKNYTNRNSKKVHSVHAMKLKCTSLADNQMHEFNTLYSGEAEIGRTRRVLGFMINLSPDLRTTYSNDIKKKKVKLM